MARIFLSHSSKDNAAAVALHGWLVAEGWDDLFLDLDPERGIAAGERWERRLHEAANRCEAVLFLVSRAWLASPWCLKELHLARKLNKQIFGILIEDLPKADLPAEMTDTWQVVNLAAGGDHLIFRPVIPPDKEMHATFSASGLRRLRVGLTRAGLDARFFAWPPEGDPERPPYRGLRPLEAEDAGIFFGREAPMIEALDRLRGLREAAAPRLFVILGASGAGKSSFLRAGLLPRLGRDDRHFLVLPVVRPERAALSGETGLLRSLEQGLKAQGLSHTRARLREAVTGGAAALSEILIELAERARVPALEEQAPSQLPTLVLPLDQGEELFLAEGAEEAKVFIGLLRGLALAPTPALIVVMTIRSDSFERLQREEALEGLPLQTQSLPPLPRGAYQTVIEGPAQRLAQSRRPLKIEPKLTAKLLADLEKGGGKDALPLLAFTLERLYLEYGSDGDLKLSEYKALGRIKGSIAAAVERAFAEADRDPAVPRDRGAREALLRQAFIPWLAGIDPETNAPRRRVARLSEIPEEARPLVRHLIEQRLLATDISKDGETTIEPAHEALLRQWGLLQGWLEDDFAALTALEGVKRAARDWDANAKDPAWLSHAAGRLDDAERYAQREDLGHFLNELDRTYLRTCREQETQRRDRELEDARRLADANAKAAEAARSAAEADRKAAEASRLAAASSRKTARRTISAAVVAAILAILAIGAAVYGLNQAKEAERQRVAASASADEANRQSAAAVEAQNEAERQRKSAEAEAAAAEEARQEAERQKSLAETNAAEAAAQAVAAETARQEAERQRAAAEQQLHAALINESLYLAAQAQNAIDLGDYHRAIDLALAALPIDVRDSTDRPNVREAEAALARAAARDLGAALLLASPSGSPVFAIFDPIGSRILTSSGDKVALWDLATGAELVTLYQDEGYTPFAILASFSADGSLLAAALPDYTARIWEASTGQELRVINSTDGIRFASLSPNGAQLVTVSQILGGVARIWDVGTGTEFATLRKEESDVLFASFSPDGRRLLTALKDNTARVWDPATGAELAALRGHESEVLSATFNSNGTQVITVSADKTARLWDVATGDELLTLQGHEDWVVHASFSVDGRQVVTASHDRTARIWDVATGRERFTLKGHESGALSASFSSDGTLVVSAHGDGTVRLWDAATGFELAVLRGHDDEVPYASFSLDGKILVTGSADGTARLWDVRGISPIANLGLVSAASFSPDGNLLVTAFTNTAEIRDGVTGAKLRVMAAGGESSLLSVAFSPDGSQIVTASSDGDITKSQDFTARIWDSKTGAEKSILRGHADFLLSASFSPDGMKILSTSNDSTARIWDVATGSELVVLEGHSFPMSPATFSPDGTQVLTAGGWGRPGATAAVVWSATSGAQLSVLRPPEGDSFGGPPFAIFSLGGAEAAVIDGELLRLFSVSGGMERLVLRGHKDVVDSVSFSPDGKKVLTTSRDNTARIWDGETGTEVAVLIGHSDSVHRGSFSADGLRAVTASYDETARIWDAASGAELAVLRGHTGALITAFFSPDGARVLTISHDQTARLWLASKQALHADQVRLRMLSPNPLGLHQPEPEPAQLEEETAITACDRLAADPDDRQRAAPGVPWLRLGKNAASAIEACEAAVALEPSEARLSYQLARSLDAAERSMEAKAIYISAADMGYPRAMTELGFLRVLDGVGGYPALQAEGIAMLEQALLEGDVVAPFYLGLLFWFGPGDVGRDRHRAVELIAYAADIGLPHAHAQLGWLFEVERDPAFAPDLKNALLHYAIAAQTYEQQGYSEDPEYLLAVARRGSIARALPSEELRPIWEQTLDWRPTDVSAQ